MINWHTLFFLLFAVPTCIFAVAEIYQITWLKLDAHTPRYMINSDASIVAPLIFGYVLDT